MHVNWRNLVKLEILEEKVTWVREETIWSLEMLTAALASFGGVKRASSEMVVDVGNDMRLSWGFEKVVIVWGKVEGDGREGFVVGSEAIALISIAIVGWW